AEVTIADTPLRLLKPQTFMNLSGESIGAALRYFRIPVAGMLVGYDEIDFETGKVRLKFDGGHAGHNGIRNIITHVGSEFWRLRFGVGHPGDRHQVKGHVLKRATGDEEQLILASIERGVDALPTLLRDGPQRAQQELHTENDSGN
ncbi:MAG TPA: aminoacyl-tRNA hydrolase, partial [Gammaproteobacteria bacterium]|nr:aminoacyl-tRNA hydrolase [Gammaproteobacteria bacterium]